MIFNNQTLVNLVEKSNTKAHTNIRASSKANSKARTNSKANANTRAKSKADSKTKHNANAKTKVKADARFEQVSIRIIDVLQVALANRRVDLRVTEICRIAMITRSTFYAHCHSTTDAMRRYETRLMTSFFNQLPETLSKEILFTLLLNFVRREHKYFEATIPNYDFWLLQQIFKSLKPKLAGRLLNGKIYYIYAQIQIAIIGCFVCYENCNARKIMLYARKLKDTKLMDFGI